MTIIAGIGAVIGGAVEGYKAYECGDRGWDLAGDILRGAVAGGVGSVAGLATGLATGNPFAGGAAGAFANDVTKAALGGGGSVGQTVEDTVVGGAFGVVGEDFAEGAFPVRGGQNFNPFTSPRTFGPKAVQAYAGEGASDALGAANDLSGRKQHGCQ